MKAPKESDLVKQCLDLLRLRKVMAWRNNVTGVWDQARNVYRTFQGRKGVSDILGCLPGGRLIAIETKSRTGRLTPEQRQFIDEVVDNGGVAFVVRDVRDLEAFLKTLDS